MDSHRFDAITKGLSQARSRRSLTRFLGGLALGVLPATQLSREASAALLLGGERCTSKAQCKSGRCLNPDKCDCTQRSCRCTCACSNTSDPRIRCKQPSNPCKRMVCTDSGQCKVKNRTGSCQDSTGNTGTCLDGTCCIPNCAGKRCDADDGCGRNCDCTRGQACVSGTCGECPADTCTNPTPCGTTRLGDPCRCFTSTEDQVACITINEDARCQSTACSDSQCTTDLGKEAICVDFAGCPLGDTCRFWCLPKCDAV